MIGRFLRRWRIASAAYRGIREGDWEHVSEAMTRLIDTDADMINDFSWAVQKRWGQQAAWDAILATTVRRLHREYLPHKAPHLEEDSVHIRPLLKQALDLSPRDFATHPIWVHCHIVDYAAAWYDETDEETYRPWVSAAPIDPNEAIFLLAADFTLADGTRIPGYATPPSPSTIADLATTQPCLFVGEESYSFWYSSFGIDGQARERFYHTLGKPPSEVFPIAFCTRPGIVPEVLGSIPGFLRSRGKKIAVET